METIRNYLDNMLAAYPQTPELTAMKAELLGTMEDKYSELKAQGKSENEAVGIVISEFGNIDELMQELDMQPVDTGGLPVVGMELAQEFIAAKRRQGVVVAVGVAMCICAPALFLLISARGGERAGLLAILVMLLVIAAAVLLFIFSNFGMERFQFLNENIYVPADVAAYVRRERDVFMPRRNLRTLAGVLLLFLALIAYLCLAQLAGWDVMAIVVMFALAAAGVFCLIIAGNVIAAFDMLLQTNGFDPQQKEAGRVIGAVAAVWWPVCILVYLLWSFASRAWHVTWVIWPASALLFGAFSGAYNIIKGGKR